MAMGRQGAVSVTPFGEGREKGLQADDHPAGREAAGDGPRVGSEYSALVVLLADGEPETILDPDLLTRFHLFDL
ncbi:MAG: hypothetical protein HYY88_11810, partial [candidate division NC10 bacterium]|nr:hypothetical protein [candidate division NC10 bacterium]